MSTMADVVAALGGLVLDQVAALGDVTIFMLRTFRWLVTRAPRKGTLLPSFYQIGVLSLPVVALTGTFIGMVLAEQSYAQFRFFRLETRLGGVINVSLLRELGPVLAATMLAGRVGSAMAAELGTMRVTEQIDALNVMGTDPIKKLVTPRLLAALVMLPTLTVINDLAGILGGMVIARFYLQLPTTLYWSTIWDQISSGGFLWLIPNDFVHGLFKPFVFGGIISLTACHFGLRTTGGTEGVGISTTRTVVTASILILVVDYFITQLLLAVLPS